MIFLLQAFAQYKYGINLGDSGIVTLNSKSNFLYTGIDNVIEIKNVPFSNYFLTTNNGIVFPDSIQYITIPSRSGKARIVVFEINGVDTSIFGYNYFTVKNIPDPMLKIDTFCFSEKDTISKKTFLKADSLNICFSNDIIGSENWFKIVRYSIGYVYGGFYKSYNYDGNKLNNEIKYIVNNLGPGKDIVIKLIAEGEGMLRKELPIYRLVLY